MGNIRTILRIQKYRAWQLVSPQEIGDMEEGWTYTFEGTKLNRVFIKGIGVAEIGDWIILDETNNPKFILSQNTYDSEGWAIDG